LEGNLRESQSQRARQIANTLLADVRQTGEAYVTREVEDRFAPEANGRFIRITRPDGSILYESGIPKDQSFDPTHLPVPAPSAREEFFRTLRLSGNVTLLVAAVQHTVPGIGSYRVEVGVPLGPLQTMLDHLYL